MATENLYPAIRPSLDLNFAGSKALDPRITFSRASAATYYDGKAVAKAEENLFTNSDGPLQTAQNGAVYNGDGTISFSAATNYSYKVASKLIDAGVQFTVSVLLSGSGIVRFGALSGNGGNLGVYTPISLTATPTKYSFTVFNAYSGPSCGFQILGASDGSAAIVKIEKYQFEVRDQATAYTPTTTQPITNYIPVLQTAPANVPRIDHDPVTGECKGLLIEEQRTNMVLRSEDFTASVWPKSGCSIYADQTAAPDGTLSADLVEFSGSGQINSNGSAATVSGAHTFSFFVKPYAGLTGNSQFLIRNGTTATNLLNATLTWSSMTVSANGSITSLSNGWYRLSITVTSGISVGDLLLGYPISGAVAGLKFFLWGAQLEAGSFPTSYIKTEASQATRAADSAQMTGTNFSSWYRQDEGSIFAEFQQYPAVPTLSQRVLQVGSSGSAEGHLISRATDRFNAGTYASGTYQASFAVTDSGTESTRNKICYSYKVNSFSGAGNGKVSAEDTSGIVPVVSMLYIGSAASNILNGYIRRITYYPKRLTDAQLQALTA